jgi:hypothetical protein
MGLKMNGMGTPGGVNKIDAVVGRLAKLVRLRFGGELQFNKFVSSSADHSSLRETLLKNSPVCLKDSWYFAVFRQFEMVGFAEVRLAARPDENTLNQLADLIELYLSSVVSLADRAMELEEEENLALRLLEGQDNVLPLKRNRSMPGVLEPLRPRFGFAVSCSIEGSTFDDIRKLATEIHEYSGRSAFVYFSDLMITMPRELLELGPVTLFIPDLAELNIAEQKLLAQYLCVRPGLDRPQIVAGTLTPLNDLRASGTVLRSLTEELGRCVLRLERPFEEYQKQGIVNFFFSALVHEGAPATLN